MKPRILVVDNDPAMVDLLRQHLETEDWATEGATSGAEARAAIEREDFDVVLTDLVMEDVDGLALLRAAQAREPRPRVLLMTAFGSLETAIEAMRQGAFDYLTKPFKLAEASVAVRRALDDQRLREENRRLRAEVDRRGGFVNVVGQSQAIRTVLEQASRVAESDATVLLLGESGTGKEVVARAIHRVSPRADGPFIVVNCAAIPDALLESELFGHVKGAFTGAIQRRRGLFAEADGGTLFLDEIGEMPIALQAKLLRALQDKAVRPVGGRDEIRIDLRVISATNRDPATLVRDGRLREDLYYRIAVFPIWLPALRERPDDIPLLARHFLARAAGETGKRFDGFTDGAIAWLTAQRWPGNVRELQNLVERAGILAKGPAVTTADLRNDLAPTVPSTSDAASTLAELADDHIRRVLERTKGDKRAAAKILGVSVRTLQRRTS